MLTSKFALLLLPGILGDTLDNSNSTITANSTEVVTEPAKIKGVCEGNTLYINIPESDPKLANVLYLTAGTCNEQNITNGIENAAVHDSDLGQVNITIPILNCNYQSHARVVLGGKLGNLDVVFRVLTVNADCGYKSTYEVRFDYQTVKREELPIECEETIDENGNTICIFEGARESHFQLSEFTDDFENQVNETTSKRRPGEKINLMLEGANLPENVDWAVSNCKIVTADGNEHPFFEPNAAENPSCSLDTIELSGKYFLVPNGAGGKKRQFRLNHLLFMTGEDSEEKAEDNFSLVCDVILCDSGNCQTSYDTCGEDWSESGISKEEYKEMFCDCSGYYICKVESFSSDPICELPIDSSDVVMTTYIGKNLMEDWFNGFAVTDLNGQSLDGKYQYYYNQNYNRHLSDNGYVNLDLDVFLTDAFKKFVLMWFEHQSKAHGADWCDKRLSSGSTNNGYEPMPERYNGLFCIPDTDNNNIGMLLNVEGLPLYELEFHHKFYYIHLIKTGYIHRDYGYTTYGDQCLITSKRVLVGRNIEVFTETQDLLDQGIISTDDNLYDDFLANNDLTTTKWSAVRVTADARCDEFWSNSIGFDVSKFTTFREYFETN